MKKPWSITTTLRNPERIRNFLIVLKALEGQEWNEENQIKYQILLIKDRFYGLTNQFYNGLSKKHIELLSGPDPISYNEAKEIFYSKNYEDPAMRGRQSINPIKKVGLARIGSGKIKITSLGECLLKEDYDLGEMFFRSFLKWQLPNPASDDFKSDDGFCIKPFIATLHFIKEVNEKWQSLGKKPKGISKEEFALFVPTLIDYKEINNQAQKVIDLRLLCGGKKQAEQKKIVEKYNVDFIKEFLKTGNRTSVNQIIKNLKDYGDNTIRYFRLTRYFFIRGEGFYIDLEPRRHVEISSILKTDNAKPLKFETEDEYLNYISDINQPILPWETLVELKQIISTIIEDIEDYLNFLQQKNLSVPKFQSKDINSLSKGELKIYIDELRVYRRGLKDIEIRDESQYLNKVREYIEQLKHIYKSSAKKSIELERLTALALNALNDALSIKPNYPVGDDDEPTFTAPANKPDIECFYEKFNAVCEVTMLKDRLQWINEGQPVMRHVRDFENANLDKKVYCLFVAPQIHRDTVNTFWNAIKYEYEGSKQKIIPMTITQFIILLETLLVLKKKGLQFKHTELLRLYEQIIEMSKEAARSDEWVEKIPDAITNWKNTLLAV